MVFEFELGRLLVCPGRKLCGMLYSQKVDPEAPIVVSGISARHGIIPIHITSSSEVLGTVQVLAFVDVSKSDVSIEQLAAEFEATGKVKVLEVIKPTLDGLLIDTASDWLTIGGSRALIVPELCYGQLINGVKERFGSGGEAFLYHEGIEAGRGFGRMHLAIAAAIGITDPAVVFEKVSAPMLQWGGAGKVESVRIGESGGSISVRSLYECEGTKGKGRPYGTMFRGVLAGILRELFGRDFEVEETECVAKGDEMCSFVLRGK
ncbi:MAG: hypothetical protein QFX35_02925 [Candidatus Verstraetearchaeota archaeon]|nr:hypothetical protein [Candidatus Verstraetearchaeota archaeon]